MTASGARLAASATGFLGVPFRVHGRDPATGLDCVGLVAASLEAIGLRPIVPSGYRLRQRSIEPWVDRAQASGLTAANAPVERGDIVLCRPASAQLHLAIAECADQTIHAHAGLRRVVREPLANLGAIERIWRLPIVQGS